MTLLVRNEADIIEANLDYHLAQGVDLVIVTDHGSSDGTDELLRRYEQDGSVAVLHEEGEGHHQSVRVTRMAQFALSRHDADWVIHNDADEFWWPLAGTLRDVFAAIPPAYGQIEVQRRNFLPAPDGAGPFSSRLIYREAQSLNPSGGPLEPKVAHRAHPDVVVAPGNHSISGAALRPVPVGELLEIFHFPMRSYEQFERKVIQTGLGYETLEHRSPEVGRDQLKLLALYRDQGLRDYYERAVLDEHALQRGLADLSIVRDQRLAAFMEGLPGPPSSAERADGAAIRSLVANTLAGCLELDGLREALAAERTETGALQRRLAEQQAELVATGEALRLLRGSRLVRWSAPLRRLYYRLR